jgi:hypothetical protein
VRARSNQQNTTEPKGLAHLARDCWTYDGTPARCGTMRSEGEDVANVGNASNGRDPVSSIVECVCGCCRARCTGNQDQNERMQTAEDEGRKMNGAETNTGCVSSLMVRGPAPAPGSRDTFF